MTNRRCPDLRLAATAPDGRGDQRPASGQVTQLLQALTLHQAAAEVLADWTSSEESLPVLLAQLGAPLEAHEALLWSRDRVGSLFVRARWRARADADPAGRAPDAAAGAAATRAEPVGARLLVDAVWHSRHPRIAKLPDDRPTAPAWLIAAPAVSHDETLGVLSFCHGGPTPAGRPVLGALCAIGLNLARQLRRQRGHLSGIRLSDREIEVLQLAADGHTAPEMAEKLWIATPTVRTHLNHIYSKLGVNDRAAAVAAALRSGLID